jgi:hypothetical protein
LSAHKKHISTSLLREVSGTALPHEAMSAEPPARGYTGRHAASSSARHPLRNRWTAGAIAIAAVGAVAAVAATTPWAGGSGLADAAHGAQASPSGLATSAHGGGQASTTNSTSAQKVGQPAVARMATRSPTAPAGKASSRSATGPASKQATSGSGGTTSHASAAATAGSSSQSSEPVLFYDSVEPSVLPAGQAAAVYADGPFATSSASVAGHGNVLWIDVNGSDPNANVLDVEPGDASPAEAAAWASSRLAADPGSTAIIYTFLAEWPSVIDEIDTLPSSMQSHVKYWISDPTGVPHMVQGAVATQWAWGSQYDSDEAEPGVLA